MKIKYSYYIIASAVFLISAYFMGYFWGKTKKPSADPKDQAAQQVNKKNLSYSPVQYAAFGDKIWEACNTMFSIDEKAILSVFEAMKNQDDLMQLIAAFGTKTNPNWRILGDDRNLPQFIAYECSKDQVNKINSILAAKGINYSF